MTKTGYYVWYDGQDWVLEGCGEYAFVEYYETLIGATEAIHRRQDAIDDVENEGSL
jgi:hypothetical protein